MQLAENIILPTTDIVNEWFKTTSKMTIIDYDFGEIINMVFTCCSVEDDFEYLNITTKTISQLSENRDLTDKEIIVNAFNVLCSEIRRLLKAAELYDVFLMVRYKTQIIDDWVVEPCGDYWEKINRRVTLY